MNLLAFMMGNVVILKIKRMLKWLTFLAFSLLSFSLYSQQVNFHNSTGKLKPVSGFTIYSDCAVDMNGDHLDDVVRTGNEVIYIDFQQLDGTFTQRYFNIVAHSLPSWSICAGDIDNNGFNDLLFADSASVSFVKASDNGSFYTETVMPGNIFSQRSTMADIDNNGWLDGFVCNDNDLSALIETMELETCRLTRTSS
ncbi:MAG: VCBS repeat-containing protein [Saprospiraceae bacterium]|nr:VCBS repeat-containing protein [Saprospiraceae bacterium]